MTSLTLVGLALGLAGQSTTPVDPYLLELGRPGRVRVGMGYTDTRTGRPVTPDQIAAAADGHRFVYLGESHDSAEHHAQQAAIIEALVRRGRQVVVGFEMFTRPWQSALNPWTLGWWTEAEFLERANWRQNWGMDFALYRPIFEATRKHRLPMVALNVPRDWVRAVGRGGPQALTAEQRAELPDLFLGLDSHQQVFNALMGGHPTGGTAGSNIYAAQVLWDEAMADTALKYMDRLPGGKSAVMAVVAGSGHVMYESGINARVHRRTGEMGISVVMIDSAEPREVARGIADFVFVSPPPASRARQ